MKLAALTALMSEEQCVRIVAHAIDRPILEREVAKIARGKVDLGSRKREELALAALAFAKKDKALRKVLEREFVEATLIERAKLAQMQSWREELQPYLEQRRSSAKFLLAMAVRAADGESEWAERLSSVLLELERAARATAELLQKADAAGIGDSLRSLESAFQETARSKGSLEAQVNNLEMQRAAVVVELGQREAELKRQREQGEALSREIERLRSAGAASAGQDGERDALKQKLRKLEKAASFAREREHDREHLRLVEHERDVLAKEIALMRVQLQLAQITRVSTEISARPPPAPEPKAPKSVKGESRRSALYVDGANVAQAARLLYDRVVSYAQLRDQLLPKDRSAALFAYVVDGQDERFSTFVRTIKREGFTVIKRAPKTLPDGSQKADLDVHLAVDVMAARQGYDRVVLVSGDSDFVPLVKQLKSEGIRVEAAAFRARAASELIAAVDAFIPLDQKVLV